MWTLGRTSDISAWLEPKISFSFFFFIFFFTFSSPPDQASSKAVYYKGHMTISRLVLTVWVEFVVVTN